MLVLTAEREGPGTVALLAVSSLGEKVLTQLWGHTNPSLEGKHLRGSSWYMKVRTPAQNTAMDGSKDCQSAFHHCIRGVLTMERSHL